MLSVSRVRKRQSTSHIFTQNIRCILSINSGYRRYNHNHRTKYSELSKAYQEKEKIYSSNPSIENKFEVEKAESAYITIAYLKDKLMF